MTFDDRWRSACWRRHLLALLVSLLAAPSPAPGATRTDDMAPALLGMIGCWQLVAESTDDAPAICVRRLPKTRGITMSEFRNGSVVSETIWVGDGRRRPIDEPGCSGWKLSTLSQDRRRVYRRSQVTCEGSGLATTTGIAMITAPDRRIEISVLEIDGLRDVSVRVLRSVSGATVRLDEKPSAAVRNARLFSTSRLKAADVVEALEWVDPTAVEALLVETRPQFGMNAELLVELADAGVPEPIIDLMVAVSYPRSFVVEGNAVRRATPAFVRSPSRYYGFYGSYFYPWHRYDYWGYWGYWGGYPYPRPPIVHPPETRGGRVIAGRGYTRVSPAGAGGSAPVDPGEAGGSGGSRGGAVSARGHQRGDDPVGHSPPTRRAKPRD